jgi:hypothetical protein
MPSVVQTTTKIDSSTPSTFRLITGVTNGNTIVVVVSCDNQQTVSSVTDGVNTYVEDVATPTPGPTQHQHCSIWRASSVTAAGGNLTITVSLSGIANNVFVTIAEVSGPCTLDQTNSNATALPFPSGNMVTGNVTTSTATDLCFAGIGTDATSYTSPPTGALSTWTAVLASAPGGGSAYVVLSSIQSVGAKWATSSGAAGSYAAAIVTYYGAPPTPPPTRQPSQQLYFEQPNWWQEWSAYARVPFAPWYVPQSGLPRQASQQIESLPVLDSWWEQFRKLPTPVAYIPTPPPTRQSSQVIVTLPDFWQSYAAYTEVSFAPWFIPPKPPTRQLSQRSDPLLDPNDQWFRQHRTWPVPVTFVPPPIPPALEVIRQQLYWDLPDTNYIWWEQRHISPPRIIPIPSGITVSQEGVFGIQGVAGGVSQTGFFRVQNNIEGYVAYVGAGSPPDLTQPPAVFSATLPVPITFNAPLSGTLTFYILVRKQDTYGLQSQNQHFTTLTIDQFGHVILPPLSAPQQLSLIAQAGQMLKVMAVYPGALTDSSPGDNWKVWIKLNFPPVPGVDPANLVPVSGIYLASAFGPLTPGVYYVLVGVSRSADNALSATLSGTITIAGPPAEVLPVPGGSQQ